MTRLWLRHDEVTGRLRKSLLHPQSREGAEDSFDIACRKCLNPEAAVVESDAHRAHRHLRLLVKRQRWRRVERNQVPDELRPAIRDALNSDERQRGVGAVHLETIWTCYRGRQADVVEYRADGDDLVVVVKSAAVL